MAKKKARPPAGKVKKKASPPAAAAAPAAAPADADEGELLVAPARRLRPEVQLGPPVEARTKKAKEAQALWTQDRHGALDAFLQGQVEMGCRRFGQGTVVVGDATRGLFVTIPCPSLAFEHVLGNDGFPLGVVVQLVGPPGSGKSGLVAEFIRWFYLAGGGGRVMECEDKFDPKWYASILTERLWSIIPLDHCHSVDSWQDHLTWGIRDAQEALIGTKEAPGPGRTVPMLYAVDSILGRQAEETQEKIVGTAAVRGRLGGARKAQHGQKVKYHAGSGHAGRGYALEAQLITRYLRTIPAQVAGWPFTLVLVNHLRFYTDERGVTERHVGGGEQTKFQESFELQLERQGGAHMIRCEDFEGFRVKLTCTKSSFGPTGRWCRTRLIWWYEEDADGWHQVTAWDWDWALVDLLLGLLSSDSPLAHPMLRANLKKIDFHLEATASGDVDNAAWSRDLGMKEGDAVPWTELGARIRGDEALCGRLRDALRILPRPVLASDYARQLRSLREELP